MSDALSDLKSALKAFQDQVSADSLATETKVREAKAVLDSVTGEQSQHAAMAALAAAISTAMAGEAWVKSKSPSTFRHYVWAAAGAVVSAGGGVAWWLLR